MFSEIIWSRVGRPESNNCRLPKTFEEWLTEVFYCGGNISSEVTVWQWLSQINISTIFKNVTQVIILEYINVNLFLLISLAFESSSEKILT